MRSVRRERVLVERLAQRKMYRRPLLQKRKREADPLPKEDLGQGSDSGRFFKILYRNKPTNKKHKTWDGDGFLKLTSKVCILLGEDGRTELGRTAASGSVLALEVGSEVKVAGKECRIEEEISPDQFQGESRSSGLVPEKDSPSLASSSGPGKLMPFKRPTFSGSLHGPGLHASAGIGTQALPKFDPTKENALVMSRIGSARQDGPLSELNDISPNQDGSSENAKEIPVVVDPFIAKHLKDYQRAGVAFMYDCCMGIRSRQESYWVAFLLMRFVLYRPL